MRQVAVEATTVQQALVLRLSGALTLETAPETTQALLDATALPSPPSLLVLDIRNMDLLSAAGLSVLRTFIESRAERGIRANLLVTPGNPVARVLDIADPGSNLPRFTELEQALAGPDGTSMPGIADDGVLAGQFATLTRMLLNTRTVGEALHHVVAVAGVVVRNADVVSVTLRASDGRCFTPESSDEVAGELDQMQYRSGGGPCVEAADPDGPACVASDDLHREQRWPEFTGAAIDRGFGAIMSAALVSGTGSAHVTGALNIYSRRPHGLTTTDRHAALLLATHVSLALAHVQSAELADVRLAQFRQAVDTRDVIGQAKGILMHRQGITANEAFALLRRTSQELNVKLVDLARTVAKRRGELDSR